MTSSSLIQRVQLKDEGAWCALTELYGPLVYNWFRRAGMTPEDSADLLQEVFRSLLIHVPSFTRRSTGSFRSWLWTITRNKIHDHRKTQGYKAKAAGGTDAQLELLNLPELEPDDSSESAISGSDGLTYRALQIVRTEFKETTWHAFWRSTVDEVSPAAVAEELGISINSVYQAKSRALRRLRELLE